MYQIASFTKRYLGEPLNYVFTTSPIFLKTILPAPYLIMDLCPCSRVMYANRCSIHASNAIIITFYANIIIFTRKCDIIEYFSV